ncbi:nucleoid-associated protein [Pleomorphochaeta sp. DL1XJH-081]|uniref:nucleoid-associated protein n=1 Tax=Pleomorphochaeta sp. DL1XJH-081 TaxID=3409690 RepID=UPI003BB72B58
MPDTERGNINFIIAHKIFKEQNSELIDDQFAEELIEINTVSELFVDSFKKAHNVRQGVQYGVFIADQNVYPVQKFVRDYCNSMNSESFLAFSKKIGKHLKKCLKDDKRSAGGYLIIFDYSDEVRGHVVAIALMTDKANSGIDAETLKFTQSMTLDLQHMHVATTVMIDRLLQNEDAINHLTFMTGLRNISSLYKTNFIGCDNIQLSAKATRSALDAVENYLKHERGYSDTEMNVARRSIVEYFDSNPFEVTIQEMKNIVLPNPDDQDKFDEFVAREQLELSSSFKPNKISYKPWKKFYYKKSGIIIDIDASKVDDETVTYDVEESQLVISDPSGDLLREYKRFIYEAEPGE